jgi:transposase
VPQDVPPAARIDGRRLGHATAAAIRKLSVRRVQGGETPARVMQQFGLCRTTIYRWLRAVRTDGMAALDRRKHPGRPPRLSEVQGREVRKWILAGGPAHHGLVGALWTRKSVAELVRRRFGVSLTTMGAGRLLRRVGIVPTAGLPARVEQGERAEMLLFAVDGRGSFLCRRLSADRGPGALNRAMADLRAAAGRHVQFRTAVDP